MTLEQVLAWHGRGNLREAEQGYRRVLAKDPGCHEALQGLGLVMHQKGRPDQAASLINEALGLCPQRADYHYNLGEVLRAAGRCAEAVGAYQAAIHRDDTQPDHFFGLGNALLELGAADEAVGAFRHALRLAPSDAEIHNNLGNALAEAGDAGGAVRHLRRAVSLSPGYAEAHHNLSLALKESGTLEQALVHARQACDREPRRVEALLNLAQLLDSSGDKSAAAQCYRQALELSAGTPGILASIASGLQRLAEPRAALDLYRRVIEMEPEVADHRVAICRCLIEVQRFDEAEVEGRRALRIDPGHALAHATLAVCLQAQGRFAEAGELLQRALARQPTLTEAAYLLATDGSREVSEPLLERWQALLEDASLPDDKRCHLHFAVAKAVERRGDHEAAFRQFEQANRVKARLYPFNARQHSDYVQRVKATFVSDFFEQRGDYGSGDDRPVFIVGMPRSGSTLVEQILSSHRDAAGIGEHAWMRDLMRDLPGLLDAGQGSPECCRELSPDMSRQLARQYLDSVPHAAAGARRISDKMLGNFLRLGLIALLFPSARVVHCVRDPLDTCVSCFTQDFARGLRFTTSLDNLVSFYRDYRDLMAHWRRVLPLPILDLRYESLVRDPETITRELVDFCGLPWDEACLSPHRNRREVATASVWQARQPVYRDSIGRWRRYEAFLAPLVEGLESLDVDESV